MFVGEFQNGLREGYFNISLAQRPVTSLAKEVTLAGCYIKHEENNDEKRPDMTKSIPLVIFIAYNTHKIITTPRPFEIGRHSCDAQNL